MLSVQQMLLGAVPAANIASFYPDMGPGRSLLAGSIYFNHNSIIVPNSDGAFAVGTGDYCIEWWMWMDPNSQNNGRQWQIGNWPSAAFGVSIEGISTIRNFYLWTNGSIIGASISEPQNKRLYKCWNHWCVERVSGTTTIYMNGVALTTSYNSYNITSTSDPRIGSEGDGSNGMTGYIADFHVMKGSAKYNGAFTPPVVSVQATPYTTFLMNTVSDFTDSSTNNKTVTVDGATWDPRGPYLAPQILLDGSANSYPGAGGTWYNLGRSDANAQLISQMGVIDGAMNFNDYWGEQNAYAVMGSGSNPLLANLTNGISVIAVYDLMSADNYERIIDFGNGPGNKNIILCRTGTSDELLWDVYDANSSRAASATGQAAAGKKMAVALSSPTETTVYSGSTGGNTGGIVLPNGQRTFMFIGRSNWNSDAYLHGKIYHLSVFDRALTISEISAAQSKLTALYGL